jgi:hypothetical protein
MWADTRYVAVNRPGLHIPKQQEECCCSAASVPHMYYIIYVLYHIWYDTNATDVISGTRLPYCCNPEDSGKDAA